MKGGLITKDLRPTFQGSSESCVCSQDMSANFLTTGKFTMKQNTALPESPMMDEKKRSVTWLHKRSFFDEHKSMLLFLLPAEYTIFHFTSYSWYIMSEEGRDTRGLEKRGNTKILITKRPSLSWKQNTKNFSNNYARHKAPALQC